MLTIFAGALILSACLVLLMYVPTIRVGLNLADEGYLWHGTLLVLQGKVPIRDFRAYDPGRYYWCSLWMRALGRNLLSLRIGLVAAQVLGLAAGMTAVHVATGDWQSAVLSGLAIAPWMHPRHKQIDVMLAMLAVLTAVTLAASPTPMQYLLTGAFVGVSFFFGLNHGLYAGGGCLLLLVILAACGEGLAIGASLVWYALGMSGGLLPMLVMFAVPGFARQYWEQKVLRILKRGTTNLSLPVPWLWRRRSVHLNGLNNTTALVVSVVYTAMPVFFLAIFLMFLSGFESVSQHELRLVAVSCVGIFYMHHAMSRADLSHLAQANSPFLIALTICLTAYPFGWVGVVGLASVSFWFIFMKAGPAGEKSADMEPIELGGTTLWLSREMRDYVSCMRDLVDTHTKPGDPVLMLPILVTLYPMTDRIPAAYNLFCVYPADDDEQLRMIAELERSNASFALINNLALDGCEELRFSNTHKLVWDYLQRNFQALDVKDDLPACHHAYVRRPDGTDHLLQGQTLASSGLASA